MDHLVKGRKTRLDNIVIPAQSQAADTEAYNDPNVDLPLQDRDHVPVRVNVAMLLTEGFHPSETGPTRP